MSPNLIAGTKTNRWDSSFTSPVCSIRGEAPLASGTCFIPQLADRLLSSLHDRMFFIQSPGGIILINREDKSGIGWIIVEKFFHRDLIAQVTGNQILHLLDRLFFGFAKRQTAI